MLPAAFFIALHSILTVLRPHRRAHENPANPHRRNGADCYCPHHSEEEGCAAPDVIGMELRALACLKGQLSESFAQAQGDAADCDRVAMEVEGCDEAEALA